MDAAGWQLKNRAGQTFCAIHTHAPFVEFGTT
jgi:hypothetical protein